MLFCRSGLLSVLLWVTLTAVHGAGVTLSLPVPAQSVSGFEGCLDQFAGSRAPVFEYVESPETLKPLCFNSFAVMYSGKSKTPVYAAEHLTRARLVAAQGLARTDSFYEEGRVPFRWRAQLVDYKGSGFDRGHMACAADMPNPDAMTQSFSLANMVPQVSEHNRGVWAMVEKSTRAYVMRTSHDVYVITGPMYLLNAGFMGQRVAVPSHLFKLVYDPAVHRAWVFVSENKADAKFPARISYSAFRGITSAEWLPALQGADPAFEK